MCTGLFPLGVKQQGREFGHLPIANAEDNQGCIWISTPPVCRWRGQGGTTFFEQDAWVYCIELFTQPPHIDSLLLINYSLNIAHKYLQQSGIAIECVTLTDRILEVPVSNLTPKTSYPQFFYSCPPSITIVCLHYCPAADKVRLARLPF
jgi:hypothetical protein